MNISHFLIVLIARRRIIFLTLAATVLATLAISLAMPKTYKAEVTLVLNYKGVDPVSGMTLPAQLMPGYIATQVDIINSKSVALNVVDALDLAEDEKLREDFQDRAKGRGDFREWIAEGLLRRISVVPSRESGVLGISFTASDPNRAADIVNAFAAAYQHASTELKAEPMKKAAAYFNEQMKVLRERVEAAQSILSRYQQEKGIVSLDSRNDVETIRLNDLSNQLVTVQGMLMEAMSRRAQAQGRRGFDSPDVAGNSLIQDIKRSLVQAQTKFAAVREDYMADHPIYLRAKAEVDRLTSELTTHTRSVTNSVVNNAEILQRREAELRAAVEAQKAKVLEINRARDELSVLAKGAESAQRAYDFAMQRYSQTSLEGEVNQTDVAILNHATPASRPNSPKVVLNTLLAAMLGTLLGTALAILWELNDRRIRSVSELAGALQAPVLGAIRLKAPRPKSLGHSRLQLTDALSAK